MKPMLAHSMDLSVVERYVTSPEWVAQQKLDGDRVLVHKTDDDVVALNRDGIPRRNAVPACAYKPFRELPGEWVLDGELIDGELWLFDMPLAAGRVLPTTPFHLRASVLERFFAGWRPDRCVRLLPTAWTATDKARLLEQVDAQHGEGLVFKHRDGLYRSGRRSGQMLKAKFTKTADVVVTAIGVDGHCNCHVAVFNNGQLVPVGSVSLLGKPAVCSGDVIEVRYLYASATFQLYQPRMVRLRPDKAPTACTLDQLIQTDRSIVSLDVPLEGVRQSRRCRSVGSLVSIVDAEQNSSFQAEGHGRWVTLCQDHGAFAHHATLAEARRLAASPQAWCPKCGDLTLRRHPLSTKRQVL